MSKKKLAAIIVGCIIVIIVVIVITHQRESTPPTGTHTLTTNISLSGAGSVSPSGGEYESGVQITLTASPASGYTFDCWSGSASGTEPIITVTMDSDKNIVANFVGNPPIQVALDFFGIKDTHQPPAYIGPNTIQLYVVADDGKKTMKSRYPSNGEGIPMDYFQLEDLSQQTIFDTSLVGDYFRISVLAYSCEDKEATMSVLTALQAYEPSIGPIVDFYERLPQRKELIGWYEHTWYAVDEWGTEQAKYEAEGQGDLRLWFRIWSDTEPPISTPLFVPEVELQDVKLPTGVRVRQPSEVFSFNTWTFEFTIANHESYELPVYWRLETSPYSPETKIGFIIYPTDGAESVPGNGKVTVTTKYWFTMSGSYTWKYTIECPEGNPITSWIGTLQVEP